MPLLPSSTIKTSLGIQPGGKVHKKFTQSCAKHMEKYVPLDSGTLRASVKTGVDYIDYDTPYAHYMWAGELYVGEESNSPWAKKGETKIPTGKDLHYNIGGSHWDSRMWASDKEMVVRETEEYLNRYGGN